MIAIDSRWGGPESWRALEAAGQRLTARHYLKALDFERGPDGGYQRAPEVWRIYVPLFWRTFLVSLGVTLLCLVIGYPVAHMIANSPPKRANVLLLLVLLPFWTSLLVRTTSWIVLLQNQGIVNDFLVAIGLIGDDGRIAMIYNMTGTFVAMTHVLLPFLVLPLYSVMRAIPPAYMNAAVSLGRRRSRRCAGSTGRRRCPVWAPAVCSPSSWRSATTSLRPWSAARAAS